MVAGSKMNLLPTETQRLARQVPTNLSNQPNFLSEALGNLFANAVAFASASPREDFVINVSFEMDEQRNVRSIRVEEDVDSRMKQSLKVFFVARKPRGRLTGPVQFFAKLLEIWELDESDGATLLGFEQESCVGDLLSGATSLRTRDAKDRIRCLFEIRAALDQLFRDETAERDWLREARPELSGNNPLALLLEGSMENVLLVKQFVERISGR